MTLHSAPIHLLIATTNEGKVNEIKAYLRELPLTIVSLSHFESIQQVAETGSTFEANAILKAKGYAKQTGLLTLADDSGLEVDALHGDPGVYSARFGKSDEDRNLRLLKELRGVANADRTARFRCVMALHDPKTDTTKTVDGVVEGLVTLEQVGAKGFGYDPVFYYPPFKATFAEIDKQTKNSVSHRGQALQKITEILRAQTAHVHI
jgi:XTP/dITP diphosphohydrolase